IGKRRNKTINRIFSNTSSLLEKAIDNASKKGKSSELFPSRFTDFLVREHRSRAPCGGRLVGNDLALNPTGGFSLEIFVQSVRTGSSACLKSFKKLSVF